MGAALTQHPQAMRAVVSQVGIYDALRWETQPNGEFNVTEFGSVKDPAQFKALYAYSPLLQRARRRRLSGRAVHDRRQRRPRRAVRIAQDDGAAAGGDVLGTNPILLRTEAAAGHGIGTALVDADRRRKRTSTRSWSTARDQGAGAAGAPEAARSSCHAERSSRIDVSGASGTVTVTATPGRRRRFAAVRACRRGTARSAARCRGPSPRCGSPASRAVAHRHHRIEQAVRPCAAGSGGPSLAHRQLRVVAVAREARRRSRRRSAKSTALATSLSSICAIEVGRAVDDGTSPSGSANAMRRARIRERDSRRRSPRPPARGRSARARRRTSACSSRVASVMRVEDRRQRGRGLPARASM